MARYEGNGDGPQRVLLFTVVAVAFVTGGGVQIEDAADAIVKNMKEAART